MDRSFKRVFVAAMFICACWDVHAQTCELRFENGAALAIPVARSQAAMRQGLMHLSDPAPGVIFAWDEPGIHGVWMKDTPAPLSAAWVDQHGRVQAILDLTPGSLEKRSSFKPSIAILEVPAGTLDRLGVRPGIKLLSASCLSLN